MHFLQVSNKIRLWTIIDNTAYRSMHSAFTEEGFRFKTITAARRNARANNRHGDDDENNTSRPHFREWSVRLSWWERKGRVPGARINTAGEIVFAKSEPTFFWHPIKHKNLLSERFSSFAATDNRRWKYFSRHGRTQNYSIFFISPLVCYRYIFITRTAIDTNGAAKWWR
jgi:hypothetical protein